MALGHRPGGERLRALLERLRLAEPSATNGPPCPLGVRRLERQVGRLLEQNERAAGRYVIDFVPDPTLRAGVRLQWTARPEWDLRTNAADWSPDELWRTYIQLTALQHASV